MLDKFENKDFSIIENQLNSLDSLPYDLIIFGMPTYGNFPPKVFDEILIRMKNLNGKRTIVFNTSRMTGKKSLEYMKAKLENVGAK